jgi:hypothetical protein
MSHRLGKQKSLIAESRAEIDFADVKCKKLLNRILYNRVVDRTEIMDDMSTAQHS